MKWNNKYFTRVIISEERKLHCGVNVILTYHHLRCDTYLGVGGFSNVETCLTLLVFHLCKQRNNQKMQ